MDDDLKYTLAGEVMLWTCWALYVAYCCITLFQGG